MSSLWAYGPTIFEVKGGEASAIELKVPRRGVIRSITVDQLDGTSNSTFQLLDARAAVAEYLDKDDEEDDPDVLKAMKAAALAHIVSSVLEIKSGRFSLTGISLPYANRDGTNANPVRRLWGLLKVPAAAETSKFSVSMIIEQVNFR